MAVAIEEASAKVSAGPPEDEEADHALPYWAGVVPLSLVAGTPQADPRLAPGIPPPNYLPVGDRRRYEGGQAAPPSPGG